MSQQLAPKAPPAQPPARLQFSSGRVGLSLNEALRAIKRPPDHVEIIREDEYFKRVEGLLSSLD